MNAVIEAWREQMQAYDRYMAALRGDGDENGHSHGHGHGSGPQRFSYTNRPLDPFRTDDPVVNILFSMVGTDTEVLDVGGGSGRLAMPLATRAKRITVVEPSEDSVELLNTRATEAGITNITVINEPWEDVPEPSADIVLCSLVLHHVMDAADFVTKLQKHARDRVVIVEMMETPGAVEVPFYERVYGSAPTPLPGLPKVLELLWALDIFPDVTMVSPETAVLDTDREGALEHLRRRLSVEEGSDADERLRAAMDDLLVDTPEGLTVRSAAPRRSAIVSWSPERD